MYVVDYTSDVFGQKNLDTLVIPVGSVEAHGHHLPLGTDIFSPEKFCRIIDKKIGETVWIAPGIPYGSSFDLSIYKGTINIPSEVMGEYMYCVGRSFHDNGIKKIVFLNGHGGNITALGLAAEKLVREGITVSIINWWMDFSKDILTVTETQGHGGEDETSAILSYNENLVDMTKAVRNDNKQLFPVRFKERGRIIFKDAITGDATLASKDKGDKIFDIVGEKIVERIKLLQQDKFYEER